MNILNVHLASVLTLYTRGNRKAWRQKIEAWLSENEKEDRAGEELQRKAKQLHNANRRSYEDSGKTFIPRTRSILPIIPS